MYPEIKPSVAISKEARLIFFSAGLLLLCACGGGGTYAVRSDESESEVSRIDPAVPSVNRSAPPQVQAVDALSLERELGDVDPSRRRAAVERLGDLASEDAIRSLEGALLDRDPEIRDAAIDELSDMTEEGSALALSIALWSDDPDVREDAIHALADVGGPTAIGLLEQSLSDEERHIREAAAELLAEIHLHEARNNEGQQGL